MQDELSRNNHYVPQLYLRNWGENDRIWTYELLVPDEKVPIWKNKSISKTASINNLYVRVEEGKEIDDFEKMLNEDYESDVSVPLYKACNDMKLSMKDWENLIDYLGVQIIRTPAFYNSLLPYLMKGVESGLKEIVERVKKVTKEEIISANNNNLSNDERFHLPLKFERTGELTDDNDEYIKISCVVGKSTWLWTIENILLGFLKRLHKYRWSILLCSDEVEWSTSDNLVVCINHDAKEKYSFWGVLGNSGNEIIFPISPKRALYLQIGVWHEARIKLNKNESEKIQRVIVENAFRYVYSSKVDDNITKIRPRIVDLEMFKFDKKQIDEWYEKYLNEEGEYYK